jgi:hypothetical protein
MEIPPEPTKPKAGNSIRGRGWPDVAFHLGALIISRNLLLPAGGLAFILLVAYKLNSADLRGLLETIINRRGFSVSGWILFLGSIFVSVRIIKWQGRMYRERIDELKKSSEGSSQEQLRLESDRPQITNKTK